MTGWTLLDETDGPASPPRSNGELVFAVPWESRAFGVAIALSQGEHCDWEDFRGRLIAEIDAWQRDHVGDDGADWSYYERWLAALERLVLEAGMLSADEIGARAAHLEHEDAHDHDGHDDHHHHHHH